MTMPDWQQARERGLTAIGSALLTADDWLHDHLIAARLPLAPVELIELTPELPGSSWRLESGRAGWRLAPEGGAFPPGRWRLCAGGGGLSTRWQPLVILRFKDQPARVEALSPQASADGIWLDCSNLVELTLCPAGEAGRIRWDGAWLERPGLLRSPIHLLADNVAHPHSRAFDWWPLEGVQSELDGRAWRQIGTAARFELKPRRRDLDLPVSWPQGRGQLETGLHAPGGARLSLTIQGADSAHSVESIAGRPLLTDWPANISRVELSVDAPNGLFSFDRMLWRPQPMPRPQTQIKPSVATTTANAESKEAPVSGLMGLAGPKRDIIIDGLSKLFKPAPEASKKPAPEPAIEPRLAQVVADVALPVQPAATPIVPAAPAFTMRVTDAITVTPVAAEPVIIPAAAVEPEPVAPTLPQDAADIVSPAPVPAESTAAISARLSHLAQTRAELTLKAAEPMRPPERRIVHPAAFSARYTAVTDPNRAPCMTVLLAGCGGRDDHPLWPILARLAEGFTVRLAILPGEGDHDPAAALGGRHSGLAAILAHVEIVILSTDRPLPCNAADLFLAAEPALVPLAHALTIHATERRQVLAFQAEGPYGPPPSLLLARARALPALWIGLDPFAALRGEPPHSTLPTPWPAETPQAAGTVILAPTPEDVSWLADLAREAGLPPVDTKPQQPAAVLIDARGPLAGALDWLPVLAAGGRVIAIDPAAPDIAMPLTGWPSVLRISARPDALASVLSTLPAPPMRPEKPENWPADWPAALDEHFDGVMDRILESFV